MPTQTLKAVKDLLPYLGYGVLFGLFIIAAMTLPSFVRSLL
jgi:hypothetical protein